MSELTQLQQALGITKAQAKVMTVVSINDGKARLEANGDVVIVTGNYAIGTQLVVRAGNVESVVPKSVTVIYG